MKVHAEPKWLHEPLPGGDPRATVAVEPLSGGEVRWPLEAMEAPGGPLEGLKATGLLTPRSKWLWVPCPAFLITHPTAGQVLVDTSHLDRKSTRLNSSHTVNSYAVFCLKKH